MESFGANEQIDPPFSGDEWAEGTILNTTEYAGLKYNIKKLCAADSRPDNYCCSLVELKYLEKGLAGLEREVQ